MKKVSFFSISVFIIANSAMVGSTPIDVISHIYNIDVGFIGAPRYYNESRHAFDASKGSGGSLTQMIKGPAITTCSATIYEFGIRTVAGNFDFFQAYSQANAQWLFETNAEHLQVEINAHTGGSANGEANTSCRWLLYDITSGIIDHGSFDFTHSGFIQDNWDEIYQEDFETASFKANRTWNLKPYATYGLIIDSRCETWMGGPHVDISFSITEVPVPEPSFFQFITTSFAIFVFFIFGTNNLKRMSKWLNITCFV